VSRNKEEEKRGIERSPSKQMHRGSKGCGNQPTSKELRSQKKKMGDDEIQTEKKDGGVRRTWRTSKNSGVDHQKREARTGPKTQFDRPERSIVSQKRREPTKR